MAHLRLANKHGTPAEIAEHAQGYTANGESVYSRKSARGPTRFEGRAPRKTAGSHTLHQQIGEVERQIEYLEVELKIADAKAEKDKIARSLVIKAKFLTRLRVEAEGLRND